MMEPELASRLARTVSEVYADLQLRLAADLGHRLANGLHRQDYVAVKLASATAVRMWAERAVTALDGPLRDRVALAILQAWERGGHEALSALATARRAHPEWLAAAEVQDLPESLRDRVHARRPGIAAELDRVARHLPGAASINRLVGALVARISGTHLGILRWHADAYRDVVAAVTPVQLAGVETRRKVAQEAWQRLLMRGITGFRDAGGRRWELLSYVEMATRTTAAQALVEGHLDRLDAAGIDLVMVSNSPRECPRCRPWEGRVLVRRGAAGRRSIEVPSAVSDRMVRVPVAGSLAEAIADGLMHPNCTHRVSGYLPGATRIPRATANPEGYRERQRLRELERRVRKWKLVEASAIDPAAKRYGMQRVRSAQAAIRAHVDRTGLIRQPARERINAAR